MSNKTVTCHIGQCGMKFTSTRILQKHLYVHEEAEKERRRSCENATHSVPRELSKNDGALQIAADYLLQDAKHFPELAKTFRLLKVCFIAYLQHVLNEKRRLHGDKCSDVKSLILCKNTFLRKWRLIAEGEGDPVLTMRSRNNANSFNTVIVFLLEKASRKSVPSSILATLITSVKRYIGKVICAKKGDYLELRDLRRSKKWDRLCHIVSNTRNRNLKAPLVRKAVSAKPKCQKKQKLSKKPIKIKRNVDGLSEDVEGEEKEVSNQVSAKKAMVSANLKGKKQKLGQKPIRMKRNVGIVCKDRDERKENGVSKVSAKAKASAKPQCLKLIKRKVGRVSDDDDEVVKKDVSEAVSAKRRAIQECKKQNLVKRNVEKQVTEDYFDARGLFVYKGLHRGEVVWAPHITFKESWPCIVTHLNRTTALVKFFGTKDHGDVPLHRLRPFKPKTGISGEIQAWRSWKFTKFQLALTAADEYYDKLNSGFVPLASQARTAGVNSSKRLLKSDEEVEEVSAKAEVRAKPECKKLKRRVIKRNTGGVSKDGDEGEEEVSDVRAEPECKKQKRKVIKRNRGGVSEENEAVSAKAKVSAKSECKQQKQKLIKVQSAASNTRNIMKTVHWQDTFSQFYKF